MKLENVQDIYPLSPVQQGMLFHSLLEPGSGVYMIQYQRTFEGPLHPDRLRRAWELLIQRHPVLRTAFVWEGLDEPLQVVQQKVVLPWEEHDWRDLGRNEQDIRLDAWLESDRQKGFDFSAAPLTRVTLIRMGDQTHRMIWTHHHAVMDGWSLPLVRKDLMVIYHALQNGSEPQIEERRPFRDYAAWLKQQDPAESESYWRRVFEGFKGPSLPPVDNPAPDATGSETILLYLANNTTESLRSFAKECHVTLNTLVLGAWGLLLSTYTGERDIVVGTTVSGRPPEITGVERMIGPFINTLPARVSVAPPVYVGSWLEELQTQLVEMRKYEYTPLMKIQEWAGQPGTSLFESIFIFENFPVDNTASNDQTILKVISQPNVERSHYPLSLVVSARNVVALSIGYDRSVFGNASIRRMLSHLEVLLLNMVKDACAPLATISMLTPSEADQLAVWNQTRKPYASERCLHKWIQTQSERSPDAIAVIDGDEKWTFRELNRHADEIASVLRHHGVGPDVLVAICMERCSAMVAGILGVLKSGGAYVPLDPMHPKERLAFMLEDSGAVVVLSQHRIKDRLPDVNVPVVYLDRPLPVSAPSIIKGLPSPAGPENLAYVLYTSGSAGRPNAVMIPHRAIVNHMTWMIETFSLTEKDRVFQKTSVSFDASVWEFFATLMTGGRLVLARESAQRDPAYLIDTIQSEEITTLQLVPTLLEALLNETGFSACKSLKRVFCGGEALRSELAARFYAVMDAELINFYGPAEATIDTLYWRVPRLQTQSTVPIGRPIANTQIYIVGGHGELVPPGIAGELYIAGDSVGRGYVKRPELTAEKFIPNAFDMFDRGLVYRTGDKVCYLENGVVAYLERIDLQVKKALPATAEGASTAD